MAIRILGRTPKCCNSCAEATVTDNTIAAGSSSITFDVPRRLVSVTDSDVGGGFPAASASTPSVGSVSTSFSFSYPPHVGNYQVNITVQDPKGGCVQLIVFTLNNPNPVVRPVNPGPN